MIDLRFILGISLPQSRTTSQPLELHTMGSKSLNDSVTMHNLETLLEAQLNFLIEKSCLVCWLVFDIVICHL